MSASMPFGKHIDNQLTAYDKNDTPYLVNGYPVTKHTPEILVITDPLNPDTAHILNLDTTQSLTITVLE